MSTQESPRKKLVVIDGKSVFYRGYYAMPNLTTKDGIGTGGVYGFATMALEVIKRLHPDYVAVAWDKPKTNIRRRLALYPHYKAGRKPAPEGFKEQIPILHELLEAFGWPLYELDDYEADDIMGSLAVQAAAQNIETMLITSDLDMLQLVNGHVHVYALKTGLSNIELYSPASFEAKYGIAVQQFLDFKSLKGDSSDNIPGVPGIGEKGALELIQQYHTLDAVYDNIDLIKESLRKKLVAGKEMAYLSHELARIWTDAPIKLDLKEVDGTKANPVAIEDLLQKLEFRTLARRLPEIMQMPLNATTSNGSPTFKIGQNIVINTDAQLDKINFKTSKTLFIHSRAAGKHGRNPQCLIVSHDGLTTYTLHVGQLSSPSVVAAFKDCPPVIGYDVKSTLKIFLELGLPLPPVRHDVQVGAFLLNSLRKDHSLSELASADLAFLGLPFEDNDNQEIMSRGGEITAVIAALYKRQVNDLMLFPKVQKLARTIEWPVIGVLAQMEYAGIQLDTVYLQKFAEKVNDTISDLQQQIYAQAGTEFNISSPSQLADILFKTIGLSTQGIKKGKSGFSTAASELDKLRTQHEIIDLITQYREVSKLKNTYIDALPKLVDENSRLHTTFNLTIAQTGRLSSTDPNLQNIPTRTELGRHIRTAFVAGPGKKLVSADYSQFELRLAAVLANDTELIEMFNRGADIHTATAAQVYGRNIEDVTKGMRRAAKVINFGIIYGMSPHGLATATDMTREQAMAFIEKYKALRKPLFDYMDRLLAQARQDGYVETLFGRRRPMPDIMSSNFLVRQGAERAAINMPIQGTEADLMKLAMIHVQNRLVADFPASSQLLQIHDSILVECPTEDASSVAALLKDAMENVYTLPVRLDVDVTVADNWGDL